MISFKPLRRTLVDRDMSKMDLMELLSISSSTAAKIWKNEYVAMKIIDDICNKLNCRLDEVIEHIPDHEDKIN